MLADLPSILLESATWAAATFLVAAGLTLMFGVLHILNFSHGAFFATGAYVAFSVAASLGGDVSILGFIGMGVAAALAVALLGVVADITVFRRLRGVNPAYVLIATYALLLVMNGLIKLTWGLNPASVAPPDILAGALLIGDAVLPRYDLFVIGCGVSVLVALELLLRHTRFGRLMQAVGMDPWAARLLGVNVAAVYSITLVIGFGLAGLAGGLLAANQGLAPEMGDAVTIQAFGIIIVGGFGSVRGAFAAALLLGLINTFGDVLLPEYPGIFFYIGLGAILLLRPQGLAGRARVA